MTDKPVSKARKDRLTRQNKGTRAAPIAEVLPPEALLADDPPPVAADMDDSLPPDLDFTPVPRRPRSNGLTPKRQRLFIKYLALTGSVSAACRAIGCSDYAIYHLKHSPGAESFAHAWERAVERGARRVRDVLIEQAIDGIPERIYRDGQLVAERRVFNTRAQMWIAAPYMSERFGAPGSRMHGTGRQAAGKQLEAQLGAEQDEQMRRDVTDARGEFVRRINAIRRVFKRTIAPDPAKRAAWELLTGPTDWSDFDKVTDYGDPAPPTNQQRPDMIVTMAAPLGKNGETVAEALLGRED